MREASRSGPIPASIGTIFGGLWALIAAMALPPIWRIPATVIAAVSTAILIVRLWRAERPAAGPPTRLFGRKAYRIAVVAEVLAIYAASAALPRLGWQAYFIQAVGIIVGLHFIGLWRATRSGRFVGIAAGMCIVSALAILLPATVRLVDLRDFVAGAGNALVLWMGAGRAARVRS